MDSKSKSKRIGSRKHKKHKEKDKEKRFESETNPSEQKPLRLVLKVPTAYSTQNSPNPTAAAQPAAPVLEPQMEMDDNEAPPKLMAFSGPSPQASQSSSKKMKKKKSKKKHRKHSHSHSGHSHSRHRHRSHHRRHHGSCSHHSRQSQDAANASLPGLPPVPTKSPQKSSQGSSKSSSKSQFQQFLSYLLKKLQGKDIQQFFAWPVSDMIAPGYSSIISQPMDLSTMKKKIDQNEYETLIEFKADVKLMCDNCQKYNRPDTVYYKAASKLWHYTKNKLLNKDSITEAIRSHPGLSSYELGFSFDDQNTSITSEVDGNRAPDLTSSTQMTIGETLPLPEDGQELQEAEPMDEDGLTPEQILEEAKKAAQGAADRLTLERPNGANFSFLRQRADGSTTLSILGNHSYEHNVNLEAMVGRLVEGTAALAPFKEAEANIIKPIESVNESPFASYLPSFDSSKATINEEESNLLLSTYGDDEIGLQYAQSISQYAQDADYVLHLVDSLLDILTHGQHQKIAKLRERRKSSETPSQEQNISDELNIDTNTDPIQTQLDDTGALIGQLASIQYKRLSSTTLPIKPTSEEEKLANQVTDNMSNFIGSHVKPKDISDVNTIRKAMGIQIKAEK